MAKNVIINAIVEKTVTGFSGYMKGIPGATTGSSLNEIRENFEELKDLHVEYLKEKGEPYEELEKSEIKINLDLKQFFDYFGYINKSALAEKLEINKSLFRQYTSGLAPMADKRVQKITQELNKIGDELKSVSLV